MLDALYYVDRLVLPYRPRAVLLYEGDNDVLVGMTPIEVRAAFDAFVGAIRERLPSTRVYVISIKPSPSRWDLWPDMAEANRLLREACREGTGLRYIDVASAMLGRDGLPRNDLFLDDCLHMNETGYALWAAIIILSGTASGWLAAESKGARSSARRTRSAGTSSPIRSIRTTSRRRSCTCSVWITRG